MSEKTTRRDLFRPLQLVGLSLLCGLFAGIVTVIATGAFTDKVMRAVENGTYGAIPPWNLAFIVTGGIFIASLLILSILILAIDQLVPGDENPHEVRTALELASLGDAMALPAAAKLRRTGMAVAVAMPKRQLVSRSTFVHSIVVERRPAPVAPSTRSASKMSKFEIFPLDRTRPIAQPAGPASPDRPEQMAADSRHACSSPCARPAGT